MGFANRELKLLIDISKVLDEVKKTGENTNGSVHEIEDEQSLSNIDFKGLLGAIDETSKTNTKKLLDALNTTSGNTDGILNTNNRKLDELIKSNNDINSSLGNLVSALNETNKLLSDIKTDVHTIKNTERIIK